MNLLFVYIFHHNYYKKITLAYKTICSQYSHAYKVWSEYKSVRNSKSFSTKELVYKEYGSIVNIHKWITITEQISSADKRALQWFFCEKNKPNISSLHYIEYQLVAENESHIRDLLAYLKTFDQIKKSKPEALCRFTKTSKSNYTFSEIYTIVSSKEEIDSIALRLCKMHYCEKKYPQAWKLFSKNRSFDSIPLEEMEHLENRFFHVKEDFLQIYEQYKSQIRLIVGDINYSIDDFSLKNFEAEKIVIDSYSNVDPRFEVGDIDFRIVDSIKLHRLILASVDYDNSCELLNEITIGDLYQLRASLDDHNIRFDVVFEQIVDNDFLIKEYNYKKIGRHVVTKEDILNCVLPNSDLYTYLQLHSYESKIRNKVRYIIHYYHKGFQALFGVVDYKTCSLGLIDSIIKSEEKIIERNRIENEREQRNEEIQELRSCVASWYNHGYYSSIKHKWFCRYYSYHLYKESATEEMWDTWRFIWNFKNDITRGITPTGYKIALDKAVSLVENTLKETFTSSQLSKLTLVCCTASTKYKNERRFKPFAERICTDLFMENGFPHITIMHDGESKSSGGNGEVERCYDIPWFKDRYIVLFDDVRTSGRSLEREKQVLEGFGATVICAITLGQTI